MNVIDTNLDTLRQTLQEQFEQQAAQLTRLTAHRVDPGDNGLDPETVAPLVESTRQALADTTEALRRMADGSYGRCQQCQQQIPVERLEILPHARFCVPCQSRRSQ